MLSLALLSNGPPSPSNDWAITLAVALVVVAAVYLLLRPRFGWRALLWAVLLVSVTAALGCVLLVGVLSLYGSLYGLVLLTLGGAQLVAVLYFWPRRTFRQPTITREMLEPLPRGSRSGATLISVLVSIGIIAMCLTLALQAYLGGSRFVALESQRARATAACQMQIERARADGYARLPAPGEHGFEVGRDVQGEGRLVVAPGSVSNSRVITARVTWPAGERMPGGSVELVTVMTARGVGG